MVKWHKDEADASRKRYAFAMGGTDGKGKGGGGGTVLRKQRSTKARRKQGDSRQGSKVARRLGGRTCLGHSCRQLLRLLRMRLCCMLVSFLFPLVVILTTLYHKKRVQPGLVGGEAAIGLYFVISLCFWSFFSCLLYCLLQPRQTDTTAMLRVQPLVLFRRYLDLLRLLSVIP